MTIDELVSRLNGVHRTGRGVMALCPVHNDRSPSLSIHEGDRGLLLRCFAGCRLEEITQALKLRVADLFFDAGLDPHQQAAHRRDRARQRATRAAEQHREGLRIDAQRDADALIASARDLDISDWSDERLDRELNRLANAYALIEREAMHGG